MDYSMRGRARPFSVITALLVLILSLGLGGYAWADPGNGNGNANGNGNGNGNSSSAVPPGQVKQDATTSSNGATSQGAGSANASQTGAENASPNGQPANGATSQGTGSQTLAATSTTTVSATADAPGSSDHSKGNASTQGNPDEPQPISNADQNPGGANGKCPGGPYCSTRDGSASLNGNGNGRAYGKPCAGCVGKADNKNPKGQYPDGKRDGNRGYECDNNNGIGKTNPAHTGCATPPSTCVPSTSNNNCGNPPPGCVPSSANNNCGNGCQVNCGGPGCQSNCGNPPPGCQNNCGNPPPGCQNNCGNPPPGCQSDCGHKPPTTQSCPGAQLMQGNTCVCPKKGQTIVNGKCQGPKIKGKQVFRPKPHVEVGPPVVAPAAAGLPNTGAGSGLGVDAMAGVAMLIAGGALLLLRRRTAKR